jgi:hypothetical protein
VVWWRLAVLLLDLYLVLSVGGWFLLRYLRWRMLRDGPFLEPELEALDRLHEAQEEQAGLWPSQPRSGRYGELDRRAHQALSQLSLIVAEADRLRLALAHQDLAQLTLTDALLLRCLAPILHAARALSDRQALLQQLDLAQEVLDHAHALHESVEQIPFQMRVEIQEVGGEVERLTALLQGERQQGTLNLESLGDRLQVLGKGVDVARSRIETASSPELTTADVGSSADTRWAEEVDGALTTMADELAEIDEVLASVVDSRMRAENQIERVRSRLMLVAERWAAQRERGVAQTEIRDRIDDASGQIKEIEQQLEVRTMHAYQEVMRLVEALDGELENTEAMLNDLDTLSGQSRAAVEGDVQALAQANTLCEALVHEEPLLDLDVSMVLLEKASKAYMHAEQQHGLGTIQGYQAALASSTQAKAYLGEAVSKAEQVLDQVALVRELLEGLDAETLGEWRRRADRLNEELRIYARHWEAGLAGDVAETLSLLKQVEVDLERIPPNIRYERRLRQSELDESAEMLRHAKDCLELAQESVLKLEGELERIDALRERAQEAFRVLVGSKLPELVEQSEQMLPERQKRFETMRARLYQEARRLSDPGHVDYDTLFDDLLPALVSEIQAIQADHAEDIERLYRAVRDTANQLARRWNRLRKLDPFSRPRPDEDPETLRLDLEAWRAEADSRRDDPAALQRLVGREALALNQRIDAAYEQIIEGRRSLEASRKVYFRHAQRVRDLRDALEEGAKDSDWPRLSWDLSEAERVWAKALALERDSGAAGTLLQANNELQQAVNTVQQAEQLYALAEHQVQNALRRLQEEHRAANAALEQGLQRARELRAQGGDGETEDPSWQDRVEAAEALCQEARSSLQAAQAVSTFEEALRRLREATNLLARI